MPALAWPVRTPSTRVASWSGRPKRRTPRPLQVNRRAPEPCWPASRSRSSSSAVTASRTWNCTVVPTSTSCPMAIAPEHTADQEVASPELLGLLVDDAPDLHAGTHQLSVVGAQLADHGFEPGH